MVVDRKRFLLFAASIAALTEACGAADPALSGPIDVAEPLTVVPLGDEPLPVGHVDDDGPATPMVGEPVADTLRQQCRDMKPPPGPSCESFDDTRAECEALPDVLVDEAAREAVSCLVKRSKTRSICRLGAVEQCFSTTVRKSRPATSATDRCRSLVQACSSNRFRRARLTLQSCTRAFAAVRPEGATVLGSCIAEGCDLGRCVWDLTD